MNIKKIRLAFAGFSSALMLIIGNAAVIVHAAPQDDHKVTICHRTDSVTNPYNQQSVDVDSADGNTGNDNGQSDHSEHTGPVATSQTVAQSLKDNKQNWGDIIPPHDNYGGLNWDANGQAVYNNNCNYATPGQGGGGGGGGSVLGTSTTNQGASPQVTQVPQGGVGAGAGGGSKAVSTAGAAGLGASVASVLAGLTWMARRKFVGL
jgi:hypothetical protein